MSHDDLKRRLRTETGRYERGYRAVPLPASLEATNGGRSRRLALVLATVVAGAAAAIIGVALLVAPGAAPVGEQPITTPAPSAAPTNAPTPSPSGPAGCTATDLAVSAERWGGAAGSRGTTLSISLADGAAPCHLPAQLELRMATADGALLISGLSSGTAGGTLPLDSDTDYALGVAWSNWCEARPDGPHLELRTAPLEAWIVIETPPGSADPVPPCLGSGQPTSLSLTELEARS